MQTEGEGSEGDRKYNKSIKKPKEVQCIIFQLDPIEELMLESEEGLEDEGVENDDYLSDVEKVELVEVEPVNNTKKSKKQSQITDFFVKQK